MIVADSFSFFRIGIVLTYASGDREMANVHGDVYRVAFDSANSELNEILGAFEELKSRKERIEKVVMALKPLLAASEEDGTGGQNPSDSSPDSNPHGEEMPSYQYQGTNGASADPFQRRIDSALGHGLGSREPRRFNRQM